MPRSKPARWSIPEDLKAILITGLIMLAAVAVVGWGTR